MDYLSPQGSFSPESSDDLSAEDKRELYRRHFWPVWPSIAPSSLKNRKPISSEEPGLDTVSDSHMGEYWVGNDRGSVPIAFCDGRAIYFYLYQKGELGYFDQNRVFHPRAEVLEALEVKVDECPYWPEEIFTLEEDQLKVLLSEEALERELRNH